MRAAVKPLVIVIVPGYFQQKQKRPPRAEPHRPTRVEVEKRNKDTFRRRCMSFFFCFVSCFFLFVSYLYLYVSAVGVGGWAKRGFWARYVAPLRFPTRHATTSGDYSAQSTNTFCKAPVPMFRKRRIFHSFRSPDVKSFCHGFSFGASELMPAS